MISKEEAKGKIIRLVKEFSGYSKEDLDKKSENQIKAEFIDPLFESLGWDMRKDAERESKVLKGYVDYLLKLGNQKALVIEAKATNISLLEKEGRQAVSYAHHSEIKFAVLTNFKYIRVYHSLFNIKNIDNNLLFWLEFKDFEKDFEKLWLLSKESFENKEIDKLIPKKDQRKYKPINQNILADLLQYRDWFSKDLKKLRTYLTREQIDEVVQILIDRLIFMRSVEDRGLEEKDFLLNIIKDYEQGRTNKRIWETLKIKFKIFDKEYNSKLFTESLLENEKDVFFDDETLKKVIKGLYYGVKDEQSRYEFNIIPGDLLGNIYEQYLGTILRGTKKRVSLKSESGKRKKMGIYYTPSYIVDYIVKNTVGEYIKNKSIDEILEVKIVDPACGSGSFLIRAFEEVCNAIEERLKKGEKSKSTQFGYFKGRLDLGQKASILERCIYGVDLDEKAVELAQLNLLLKLLEEETRETRRQLPLMKKNIQNGNSLIDDPKIAGDKAFNWDARFGFKFDVVVGNPPYVNNRNLPAEQKKFFEKNYQTSFQQYDLYVLFYEKSLEIMKQKGYLGFITPNKFTITRYGEPLRKLILENELKSIVDVSQLNVFDDASTYPYVIIIRKNNPNKNVICVISPNTSNLTEIPINKIDQNSFDYKKGFNLKQDSNESKILDKIEGEKLIKIYRAKPTSKSINDKGDSLALTNREIERYNIILSQKRISTKKEWKLDLPAILMKKICFYPTATLIDSENFIPVNTIYVLHSLDNKVSLKYLLAILNSKLIGWYSRNKYGNTAMRGGFIELRTFEIKDIPIHLPTPEQEKKIIELVNQMLELQKKAHDEKIVGREKDRVEEQIKQTDWQINEEVYNLYRITDEEKKTIEESLK